MRHVLQVLLQPGAHSDINNDVPKLIVMRMATFEPWPQYSAVKAFRRYPESQRGSTCVAVLQQTTLIGEAVFTTHTHTHARARSVQHVTARPLRTVRGAEGSDLV